MRKDTYAARKYVLVAGLIIFIAGLAGLIYSTITMAADRRALGDVEWRAVGLLPLHGITFWMFLVSILVTFIGIVLLVIARSRSRLRTTGEITFDTINFIILFIVGVIMLFPFYVVLIQSVAPARDFGTRNIILWPSRFTITSFRIIIGSASGIVQAYRVTLFATIVGTAANMLVSILCAVGLSNKNLPYRNTLTKLIVFTMFFGGGMIPSFMLIRHLGLLNNIWVYVMPGLMSVWNTLLLRNFFMGIPQEITESAQIDGCHELRMIWSIILPLSTAAIATISLFYAVGHWNNLGTPMMFIFEPRLNNLQAYLLTVLQDQRNMVFNPEQMAAFVEANQNRPPPTESLRAANIMAATIPIVLVYPFLQKYFVKGVVVGSLKG